MRSLCSLLSVVFLLLPAVLAYGSMKDPRDGQIYKTTQIGNQIWMAENLNFGGTCYDNHVYNCIKYGRLYTWNEARSVCPAGWHLPSRMEWDFLMDQVGGTSLAAKMLKSAKGWIHEGNGLDNFGFQAIPAGYDFVVKTKASRIFDAEERNALFWSSTDSNKDDAYAVFLSYSSDSVEFIADYKKLGLSVRCVMNNAENHFVEADSLPQQVSSTSSSSAISVVNPNFIPNDSSKVQEVLVDSRDGHVYKTVTMGLRTWMAENLNYKTANSSCADESDSACSLGRLYTWVDAMNVCPDGWHLPMQEDLNILFYAVIDSAYAGYAFKSTVGWFNRGNGWDAYGFNAIPVHGNGRYAFFWSSQEHSADDAYSLFLNYYDKGARRVIDYKGRALSVRCVKDVFKGTLTDSRDGRSYRTVTIGSQTWMAENLNYDTSFTFCYDKNFDGCSKYGRLYLESTAKNVCPTGWHLPTDSEWKTLFKAVGGLSLEKNVFSVVGRALKSKTGWEKYEKKFGEKIVINCEYCTDDYGFSAFPAGKAFFIGTPDIWKVKIEDYEAETKNTRFWSVGNGDMRSSDSKSFVELTHDSENAYLRHDGDSTFMNSVRCIKD